MVEGCLMGDNAIVTGSVVYLLAVVIAVLVYWLKNQMEGED